MTLTLEMTPGLQAWLESEAARHGFQVADYATHLLRQAAKDAKDIADVERIMAESNPSERTTLARLRTEAKAEREAALAE